MRERILELLRSLDHTLQSEVQEGRRLELYPIGRGSLILFGFLTSGRATTKDLDVLQVAQHCDSLLTILLERFGVSSEYARANEIYLESVNVGLPPVPSWYANRSQEFLPGTWSVLRVWQMENHDLATTKM